MTVFNGGYTPAAHDGLLNLHSVKQMIFCIAQNDSSAQELNAYSLLGISNILEEAGYKIEQDFNEMIDKEEKYIKRHRKLRAALAAYDESGCISDRPSIAQILADDEQGGCPMIIRTEKTSNYTILPNEFLLDETISDKARGLLARLLSRPDNWNLNINYLVKTGKDGHTAVRSAIRELEEAGYIQREVSRHANGRIIGVEYIIYESPVKSCGDNQAPEQQAPSCNETQPREVQVELFAETTLPGPKPEPKPEPSCQEIQAQDGQSQEAHIEDTCMENTRMQKTVIKETAPIIKTDIKQILKRTTTTPDPGPGICAQAMPSSFPSNEILNLIPEKHQSPMVLSLVNKAIFDYPAKEVEQAVAYAADNVRGGSLQFKAYLDKTLKNKWADGWESQQKHQADKHVIQEQFRTVQNADLKNLADVGNVAAREELKRRERHMCINTDPPRTA